MLDHLFDKMVLQLTRMLWSSSEPFFQLTVYQQVLQIKSDLGDMLQVAALSRASVNGRTGILYARKFGQNAQN